MYVCSPYSESVCLKWWLSGEGTQRLLCCLYRSASVKEGGDLLSFLL